VPFGARPKRYGPIWSSACPARRSPDATAHIDVSAESIRVYFQKRAHNPLLVAAGFDKTNVRIPWLGNKRLHLVFG